MTDNTVLQTVGEKKWLFTVERQIENMVRT